jgi:hypothetical protein
MLRSHLRRVRPAGQMGAIHRPVIGQLVAARHRVNEEWGLRATRAHRLVAVGAEVDEALAHVSRRIGISVEQVR